MRITDDVYQLIDDSLADNFLSKAEKKELKQLLINNSADKRMGDLLRNHFFKLAHSKIDATNYASIIQWLEKMNKVILSVKEEKSTYERVYFSPGEECLTAILQQIKSCKNVIKICLFTISDNRITEELIAAHKKGISVKIITDNDKVYDKGSDIHELFKNGIAVKVDVSKSHMHHKFALFDRKLTLTGSYNWTRSAERYNQENIIITSSTSIHKAFEGEYNKLWRKLIFYDKI